MSKNPILKNGILIITVKSNGDRQETLIPAENIYMTIKNINGGDVLIPTFVMYSGTFTNNPISKHKSTKPVEKSKTDKKKSATKSKTVVNKTVKDKDPYEDIFGAFDVT